MENFTAFLYVSIAPLLDMQTTLILAEILNRCLILKVRSNLDKYD